MAKEKKDESLQWYEKLSEDDADEDNQSKTRKGNGSASQIKKDSQQEKKISNVGLNRYTEVTKQWIDEVSPKKRHKTSKCATGNR